MSLLLIFLGLIVAFIFPIMFYIKLSPQFGASAKGEMLSRIWNSPNFRDGKFQNLLPTTLAAPNTSMLKNGYKFLKGVPGQYPDKPIETVKFDKFSFVKESADIKVVWFGHSSVILNIDGIIVLTDPVFSQNASPVPFGGVKSFKYSNPFIADDLPNIDLVLLSHDHYDHLDYKTILKIHSRVAQFYVPLGVGAHLLKWGVEKSKIVELDWCESGIGPKNIKLFATPSRHFSGRAGIDKDKTLWCSWVIKSKKHSVFFSGDSGYGPHFKQIGNTYGPFDLTLIECGQYNEGWPFIHMNPEESVKAHIDLNGRKMLPIHWGKFKLSLHTWTEPVERANKAAEKQSVRLILTKPGECFVIENNTIEMTGTVD